MGLSAAAIRAKLTARKAKKVSLLWERIVDGVKAKPTKHIGHLKMKLRGGLSKLRNGLSKLGHGALANLKKGGKKADAWWHSVQAKLKLRGNKASIWWASMKKKLGAKGKKTASFWASMKKRAHLGIANLNKYYKLKVKIGAKKPLIVGKNGAGRPPMINIKKPLIVGKNGAGQTPKKFLPKAKKAAVVHAKGSSCSSYPPQYQKACKESRAKALAAKKSMMVGKNGAGQTPKKFLPKKKATAKKSVILGKNGAGQTPKKFLPKKKTTAKKPVKAGKKSTWKPKRSPKNFLKMNKAAVKTKKTKKALRRLFKVKSYPNA